MFSLHFFPFLWILRYLYHHLRVFFLLFRYLLQQPPLVVSVLAVILASSFSPFLQMLQFLYWAVFSFFFLFKLIPSYLLLTCSKISPRWPIKVKTSKRDEVNGKTPSASKDGVWFAQLSDSLLCSWALLLFINHGFHIAKYLWLCSHNLGELWKGKKKKERNLLGSKLKLELKIERGC